ncbi:MAG: SAM-dependent methyltransferase [Rhodobacteraceae bacterium]|nr:SAM-dependent methyltransferase [Paracoccaceae bacterium]
MQHFPVFLSLDRRPVIVSGAGEVAVGKLRLLLKTKAAISVFGKNPVPQVVAWRESGRIRHVARRLDAGDAEGAALLYCANDDPVEDERARRIGKQVGAPVNVVDNLEASDFITPAIVDRDPVTVAIGTEGTSPTLARKIKSAVEEMLPASLGAAATACAAFRERVADRLPAAHRRAFWSRVFEPAGFESVARLQDAALEAALSEHVDSVAAGRQGAGSIQFVGSGPGRPEQVTLEARRLLEQADVVIHDSGIPGPILELARREAFMAPAANVRSGAAAPPAKGIAFALDRALAGESVVWLTPGDPILCGNVEAELQSVRAAGVTCGVVHGAPLRSSLEALRQGDELRRADLDGGLTHATASHAIANQRTGGM